MSKKTELRRVILIGDAEVGKTAMLNQFVNKKFSNTYKPTIGADFLTKGGYQVGTRNMNLQVWDTAGQERFQSLASSFYRGADLFVIVFDVTRRDTYEKVENYIAGARIQSGNENVPIVLVGNKCDLDGERVVTHAEATAFAEKNNLEFYIETSAKEAVNIDELFERGMRGVLSNESEEDVSSEEDDVELELDDKSGGASKQQKTLARITSYAEALTKLKESKHSKNDNKAGQTKGQNLQAIFGGDAAPTKDTLESILEGEQYGGLLDNRNRGPSLYKIWSLLTRHRNEFMDNRLCESKTEALLVDYYEQTFGG